MTRAPVSIEYRDVLWFPGEEQTTYRIGGRADTLVMGLFDVEPVFFIREADPSAEMRVYPSRSESLYSVDSTRVSRL
jgi:hypothetical protein